MSDEFHSGPSCPYGDATCPCQEGDPCHYEPTEETPAMRPPPTSCGTRGGAGEVKRLANPPDPQTEAEGQVALRDVLDTVDRYLPEHQAKTLRGALEARFLGGRPR